jgi:hypothetical protein
MTTMAEARAELTAALEAEDIAVSRTPGGKVPPCALIYGDGFDFAHLLRGEVRARFRITLLAGAWAQDVATELLDPMKLGAVTAVRGLAEWQLDEGRRDAVASIAGGQYLAADVVASRMVTI